MLNKWNYKYSLIVIYFHHVITAFYGSVFFLELQSCYILGDNFIYSLLTNKTVIYRPLHYVEILLHIVVRIIHIITNVSKHLLIVYNPNKHEHLSLSNFRPKL